MGTLCLTSSSCAGYRPASSTIAAGQQGGAGAHQLETWWPFPDFQPTCPILFLSGRSMRRSVPNRIGAAGLLRAKRSLMAARVGVPRGLDYGAALLAERTLTSLDYRHAKETVKRWYRFCFLAEGT